ncbi:MAG: PAS domain S-box protein [Acidimicrobiia bacterium]|nr:PAS domain S-box protein [Acidimicrobiia bacterium]
MNDAPEQSENSGRQRGDHRALVSVDADLVVRDVTEAFLAERRLACSDVVGRNLFEVLPERIDAARELLHANEQLRVSEHRFELVSNATTDALWDWDLRTGELWWSDGFERLFGHPVDTLPEGIASWTDFVHPDDVDWALESISEAIASGSDSWSAEYRFLHRSGRVVWVTDRAQFERAADGTAVRAVGGMTDITARYEAQAAVQARAELLDLTSDAVLVRDLDHRIIFWNKGAERLYGWSRDEAVGRSVRELLYRDPGRFDVATEAVLATGQWSGQLYQQRRDGQQVVVEARWTKVSDHFGRDEVILTVSTDVTERREIELQLLRTQRLESIGTLAGGLAHDLNNLLAPVLMSTELLRSEEDDPDKQAVLDLIAQSAGRGADLVRQILSFARGTAVDPEPVALAEVVEDLCNSVHEAMPDQVEVALDLDPECPELLGDRTQLMQVVLNLCLNARDAMADVDRGSLRLAVRGVSTPEGDAVELVVSDTGVGIGPDVRPRLFDPFFTTKEPGHGTGLGLPSTLAIVRSHGGDIEVDSTVGEGSTFTLRFPALVDAPTPASDGESRREPRDASDGRAVLVVDDEASVLRVTELLLEANGFEVLVALDATEAEATVVEYGERLAAVLTDATMPGRSGASLAEWIARTQPGLPVVVVSGDLHGAGPLPDTVAATLEKPYGAAELLEVLERVLGTANLPAA